MHHLKYYCAKIMEKCLTISRVAPLMLRQLRYELLKSRTVCLPDRREVYGCAGIQHTAGFEIARQLNEDGH